MVQTRSGPVIVEAFGEYRALPGDVFGDDERAGTDDVRRVEALLGVRREGLLADDAGLVVARVGDELQKARGRGGIEDDLDDVVADDLAPPPIRAQMGGAVGLDTQRRIAEDVLVEVPLHDVRVERGCRR